ncbi:MAG: hypothetical protein ACXAEU_18300 [Candidatus Hodarchaeales archaeon]
MASRVQLRRGFLIGTICLIVLVMFVNPSIGLFLAVLVVFGVVVARLTPLLVESYRSPDTERKGLAVLASGLLVMVFFALFTREREW